MLSEHDDTIRRLQHEKSVWRAIAIGLAGTLVLLLALGAVGGLWMATRSRQQAMGAEDAVMRAMQERERAEAARQDAEAQRAAERQKAKP